MVSGGGRDIAELEGKAEEGTKDLLAHLGICTPRLPAGRTVSVRRWDRSDAWLTQLRPSSCQSVTSHQYSPASSSSTRHSCRTNSVEEFRKECRFGWSLLSPYSNKPSRCRYTNISLPVGPRFLNHFTDNKDLELPVYSRQQVMATSPCSVAFSVKCTLETRTSLPGKSKRALS